MKNKKNTEDLIEKFGGEIMTEANSAKIIGGAFWEWVVPDGYGNFLSVSGGEGEIGTTGVSCNPFYLTEQEEQGQVYHMEIDGIPFELLPPM